MKIYTKTGDDGSTGLLGPGRLSKDSPRITAYGEVDELNAAIGLARAMGLDPSADTLVARIQDGLFRVGAALADPDPKGKFATAVTADHVEALEQSIDRLEVELPPLRQFILPGGSMAAAQLHLARTICRRAERATVALSRDSSQHVAPEVLIYLNRLSDLLFVLARAVNYRAGVSETPWGGL